MKTTRQTRLRIDQGLAPGQILLLMDGPSEIVTIITTHPGAVDTATSLMPHPTREKPPRAGKGR